MERRAYPSDLTDREYLALEQNVSGRNRHLLVETQGMVLLAKVHDAAIQDRRPGPSR